MEHLWKMGEGSATFNRQYNVGIDTFLAMASIYQGNLHRITQIVHTQLKLNLVPLVELYGVEEDGSVKATFEVSFSFVFYSFVIHLNLNINVNNKDDLRDWVGSRCISTKAM